MRRGWAAGMVAWALAAGSALAQDTEADMRGLSVLVGGGFESYTGGLAPRLDMGPTYEVVAILRPSRVVGLELAYTGAVHEIDTDAPVGATSGSDLVRNGGHVAFTVGLTASPVQPYLLAGVGISDYNFRGGSELGYKDDAVGNVPLGGGLRVHTGNFLADLRVTYDFLFDQQFAAEVPPSGIVLPGEVQFSTGGSYAGTLNLGGTF